MKASRSPVDERRRRAYVPGAMRVLLFLSVLLSALTGAGAGARVPNPAQAVAGRSVQALVAAPVRQAVRTRPAASLPAPKTLGAAPGADLALPASEPLWASRRRE